MAAASLSASLASNMRHAVPAVAGAETGKLQRKQHPLASPLSGKAAAGRLKQVAQAGGDPKPFAFPDSV